MFVLTNLQEHYIKMLKVRQHKNTKKADLFQLFLVTLFWIAQVVGCLNERKRLDYIQLQDLVEWLIQEHKPGDDLIT